MSSLLFPLPKGLLPALASRSRELWLGKRIVLSSPHLPEHYYPGIQFGLTGVHSSLLTGSQLNFSSFPYSDTSIRGIRAPYGAQSNLRIIGCVHLPSAYRRLPRDLAGTSLAIH